MTITTTTRVAGGHQGRHPSRAPASTALRSDLGASRTQLYYFHLIPLCYPQGAVASLPSLPPPLLTTKTTITVGDNGKNISVRRHQPPQGSYAEVNTFPGCRSTRGRLLRTPQTQLRRIKSGPTGDTRDRIPSDPPPRATTSGTGSSSPAQIGVSSSSSELKSRENNRNYHWSIGHYYTDSPNSGSTPTQSSSSSLSSFEPNLSQTHSELFSSDSDQLSHHSPTSSLVNQGTTMSTISHSHQPQQSSSGNAIKNNRIGLGSPRPLALQEAAAEREVIEDTETWDDVSDDEQFKKKMAKERASITNGNVSPTNIISKTRSNSSKSLALSGSGRGVWDIPQSTTNRVHLNSPPPSQPLPPSRSSTTRPAHQNQRHASHSERGSTNQHQHPPLQSTSTSPATSYHRNTSPHHIPNPDRATLSEAHCPSPSQVIFSKLKSPPGTHRRDLSTSSDESHPLVLKSDIDQLLEDPAHVLNLLRASTPDSVKPEYNPAVSALPWAAVIPPELISTRPLDEPEGSQTPPEVGAEYQPIPESPVRNNRHSLQDIRKQKKFLDCLGTPIVDVSELRKLSWSGIPSEIRPLVWQILLGYLPAPAERRVAVLARKRQEYADAVRLAFGKGKEALDQTIWHQIRIDVARTNPGVNLWQFPATQRSLERILYVWAIRHPASGYVQGINDLVTPFFQVFLTTYIEVDPESFDISNLPEKAVESIEADSFWSLSKLLEGIQDNYIFAQPGIQRQVARMKELCERVDARLFKHLEDEKVEFIQFAFRWINCLLMRELSTKKIIRMWDTYLAEGTAAFSEFHLYVCLAFLIRYSDKIQSMDFQSIIMFLQALPTQDWTEKDLEMLLSQAYMWSSLFQGATGHFIRK